MLTKVMALRDHLLIVKLLRIDKLVIDGGITTHKH